MTRLGEVRSNGAQVIAAASGGVMLLCAVLSLATGHRSFFTNQQASDSTTTAGAPSESAAVVTQYASRIAIVRNTPTTSGSEEVARLLRGTLVEGTWVSGVDATSTWLKVSSGPYMGDYISGVNLSTAPRPDVERWFDSDFAVKQMVQLHEEPDENSAIIDTLNAGLSVHVAAEVAGGWWEIQRRLGGVGYLQPDAFQEPNAQPATQAPGDQPAMAVEQGTTPSDDLGQLALAQVRNYWALWSSSDTASVDNLEDTYGDPVLFYGTSTAREEVMRQKQLFAERWPQRSYTIQENTLQTSCDSASASCTVTGIVDWNAQSPRRNASSVGSASFFFALDIRDGQAKITSEGGKVISRHQ